MNKRKKHSITILLVIILFTSVVGCTNKQEYILQYLDDNQELVTLVYDSVDNINAHTEHLDSIGATYWVD